jgi:hypothetical protein
MPCADVGLWAQLSGCAFFNDFPLATDDSRHRLQTFSTLIQ